MKNVAVEGCWQIKCHIYPLPQISLLKFPELMKKKSSILFAKIGGLSLKDANI